MQRLTDTYQGSWILCNEESFSFRLLYHCHETMIQGDAILNENKSSYRNFIMAAVFISTFMTSVETTIITTALPTIISSLNGLAVQSWVAAAYLLTTALSTPIYGKVSDRFGRKPVYIIGLILFTTGSLLCGLSPNIYTLILFRGVQGLGAGAIMPITFTIIADLFSYAKRSNMLALNNTAWGISALLGPLIGGFIVDQLNWHWVFFINVPLGVIVFSIVWFAYSETATVTKGVVRTPIDLKGIISLSVFLLLLLLFFQQLASSTVNFWLTGGCLAIALLALGVFGVTEKKTIDPIVPLILFKNPTFTIQILTALLLSGIQIGFQNYFPMWLQSIYQASASVAGLAVTPSPILWLIASFFVGGLVKRYAPKHIAVPIIFVQLMFYVPLAFVGSNFPQFMFYVIAGITGVSLGVVITMNTLISQRVVPGENLGTASSMLTLGRTLGQTVATGVFGLVFNFAINTHVREHHQISLRAVNRYISSGRSSSSPATTIHALNSIVLSGMHAVFGVVLVAFVLVIVLNICDKNRSVIE